MDLPLIWALILAFAVLAYVVLDGFDLGIGIPFPFLKRHERRDTAMNTIAPFWDGNETWLVLRGGGLFAVFPLAYAIVMPALYAPIIAVLLALIFRGVAFEFRWKTVRWRGVWDLSFFVGSVVAAFAQGVSLGTIVQGIEVADRAYAGGNFDWLTPFSAATGIAVVIGYARLGVNRRHDLAGRGSGLRSRVPSRRRRRPDSDDPRLHGLFLRGAAIQGFATVSSISSGETAAFLPTSIRAACMSKDPCAEHRPASPSFPKSFSLRSDNRDANGSGRLPTKGFVSLRRYSSLLRLRASLDHRSP